MKIQTVVIPHSKRQVGIECNSAERIRANVVMCPKSDWEARTDIIAIGYRSNCKRFADNDDGRGLIIRGLVRWVADLNDRMAVWRDDRVSGMWTVERICWRDIHFGRKGGQKLKEQSWRG
jgi:hypothetical protein